jgi:hypothetical protein
MKQHVKDYLGGGLMFLIGVYAIIQSLQYKLGSLTDMGSGFFPAALGLVLAVIGIAIAMRTRNEGIGDMINQITAPVARPQWRGWMCIVLSVIAFVAFGEYGGLIPATFASVFIAALGDRDNSLLSAFVVALAMVAVATVVFWWALQVQFPLFSWGW